MTEQQRAGLLAGVRVIDLTTFLSGPFATQLLADLGAEVIKVESLGGDSSRPIPPYFVGEDSAYYLSVNRNKRSFAVDLKTAEGVQLTRELIGTADVVIENFRPGVCDRLGLDPDELRAAHPHLIWSSITGFGADGPWSARAAYDMIVQAASGMMSLTGEPGGPPVRLGMPAGDLVPGLYSALGIVAALFERHRSGVGRSIDVAMYDSMLSMLSYQSSYALNAGITPPPQGSAHDSIPTYRTFVAGDGERVAVTANTDAMWAKACQVLGVPEMVEDPRFISGALRLANKEELWMSWNAAFLARPAEEWTDALNAVGVPASTIRTVPQALADSEDAGRDMVLGLHDGEHEIRVVGNPIRVGGKDGRTPHSYPPRLGADTERILRDDLKCPQGKIESLAAEKIVRVAAAPAAVTTSTTRKEDERV